MKLSFLCVMLSRRQASSAERQCWCSSWFICCVSVRQFVYLLFCFLHISVLIQHVLKRLAQHLHRNEKNKNTFLWVCEGLFSPWGPEANNILARAWPYPLEGLCCIIVLSNKSYVLLLFVCGCSSPAFCLPGLFRPRLTTRPWTTTSLRAWCVMVSPWWPSPGGGWCMRTGRCWPVQERAASSPENPSPSLCTRGWHRERRSVDSLFPETKLNPMACPSCKDLSCYRYSIC